MTERPETVEIDRQKATTMLHQLTVTRERETLSPVGDEHLETATQWLDGALQEATADEEKTPLEEWREHNESFKYEPPEKPADAWSSEEYTELYDRVIRRQVQWICDKCTGRGPIGNLEKARRHVRKQHGGDLVEQYATPRDEQDTATDGGTSESQVDERREENQSLGDFGPSSTDTDRSGGDR